jgi:hypothetical protein
VLHIAHDLSKESVIAAVGPALPNPGTGEPQRKTYSVWMERECGDRQLSGLPSGEMGFRSKVQHNGEGVSKEGTAGPTRCVQYIPHAPPQAVAFVDWVSVTVGFCPVGCWVAVVLRGP